MLDFVGSLLVLAGVVAEGAEYVVGPERAKVFDTWIRQRIEQFRGQALNRGKLSVVLALHWLRNMPWVRWLAFLVSVLVAIVTVGLLLKIRQTLISRFPDFSSQVIRYVIAIAIVEVLLALIVTRITILARALIVAVLQLWVLFLALIAYVIELPLRGFTFLLVKTPGEVFGTVGFVILLVGLIVETVSSWSAGHAQTPAP